ncbi:MAG: MFS transporter [Bacillota bacterium]|nr:MFS transporter [Bacillota bacterium]
MPTTDQLKKNFNNPFIALRHKNFRYYWIGMCVSLIGTWMQNIAQPWLAYTLTKSPFLLSLIGALQFTPVLLFSLFAGVIIDKFAKKKILIFTQFASMVITLILAILVWSGDVRYWHLVVMASALGIVNTFDMPTRQAFVVELAGREDLMNAIALNSSIFNVARIIGPALAGIVMNYVGIGDCFFANSISFGAVLISLFFIKPLPITAKPKDNSKIFTDIKDGIKYIFKNRIILDTILVIAIVGTFGPNFSVLVPVFAKEVLHQKEAGFGILMSLMGVGSFIGAMIVATTSRSGPKRVMMNAVPLLVGIFLIITGYTNAYFLTGLSLAFTGFFFVSFSSSANSTIQLNTSDEYRGRVMSIYSLVFSGSTPIGNLYAGAFTQGFSSRIGFVACGLIIILLMIPLYLYRSRRESGQGLMP